MTEWNIDSNMRACDIISPKNILLIWDKNKFGEKESEFTIWLELLLFFIRRSKKVYEILKLVSEFTPTR